MTTKTNNLLVLFTIFTLALAIPSQQAINAQMQETEGTICAMDARQCPDGSFVGRSGPNCEFVCPTSTSSEPVATNTDVSTNKPNQTEELKADWSERADEKQVIREENQTNRVVAQNERRAVLTQVRQQRIVNLAANLSNRMDATVERLFNIVGRLETRIQKLAQQGIITTQAEQELRQASQSLAEAKSLLVDIDTLVYDTTTSGQPVASWDKLKNRYQQIATHLRDSHSSLRQTISSLKLTLLNSTKGTSEETNQPEPSETENHTNGS